MFLSNNFLLGLITSVILILGIGKFVIELYSGYLYESIAFKSRVYGQWLYLRILLVTIAVALPILNYRGRFRGNHKFQYVIISIYIGLVIVNFMVGGVNSVVPGWHTTTWPQPSVLNTTLILIIGLIINYLIVKFELLPEFRRK